MPNRTSTGEDCVALLLSGGVDSSILLVHLLNQGASVQPIFVRGGLAWERDELRAARRFLAAVDAPGLRTLVTLDLPVDDLYGDHWSLTGEGVPGPTTPDEAVYLPGRNALLIVKAAVWCQLNGVDRLALAPLGSNPFADATREFFDRFAGALNLGAGGRLRIETPFMGLDKRRVMELGADAPLELTFSCIDPVEGLHCGQCNKCAERQSAFRLIGRTDSTRYAATLEM